MKYTVQTKQGVKTFSYGDGKTGKNITVILQDENDALDTGTLTLFDGQAEPNEGDSVELEKEVTEKWGTKFTIKRSNEQKKTWTGGKADPAKAASIERQVALKEAVTYSGLHTESKWNPTEVLKVADAFDKWLKHKPQQATQTPPEPDHVKQNPPLDDKIPDVPLDETQPEKF